MFRPIIFLFCFSFLELPLYAQQSVVPAGGNESGAGGMVSFTIGQIDFQTAAGTGGSCWEGVQQPNTNQSLAFVNGERQTDSFCSNSAGNSLSVVLAVYDAYIGQSISWVASSSPLNGAIVGSYTGLSMGGTTLPAGLSYTPNPGFTGVDSFTIMAVGGTDTAITTVIIRIDSVPGAGTITGTDSICIGSTVTMTDSVTGGAWSTTSTLANVSGGIVTGVNTGWDTVAYATSNFCGSSIVAHPVFVVPTPSAGSFSCPFDICAGSSVTFVDSTEGGTWSTSNSDGSISGGVFISSVAGLDTILYTVTNLCGTAVATGVITIEPLPDAGIISGPDSVCAGSTITLTSTSGSGSWLSSNGSATIAGGVVTGSSAGMDTVFYISVTVCGRDVASQRVLVLSLPMTGDLSGPDSVCAGSTIVIDSSVSGGTWQILNGSASVVNGVVTGIAQGQDTVFYVFANYCGADTTSKGIYVNSPPAPGTISGGDTICVGATISLVDTFTGGVWSASSGAVTVVSGDVTGVDTGTVTVSYTVTNSCGTGSAMRMVVVDEIPDIGLIEGATSVCVGDSIILLDSIPGGLWSSSNVRAYVTGNIVVGVSGGTDTITYTVNSACGVAAGATIITVNPFPHPQISGRTFACIDSSVTLSGYPVDGVWMTSNTNASISPTGVLTGNNPGADTVFYTVSNSCGTADTSVPVLIYTAHQCDSIALVPGLSYQSINVLVYPNPNSGSFIVALPNNTELAGATIVITDLYGRKITSKTMTENSNRFVSFDLNYLAAATYFVRVEIGGRIFRTKLVVW